MNEREIFEGALEHTEPAKRKAFLDQACGSDLALRERIEALLASHEGDASRFLNVPAPEQLRPGKGDLVTQDFTPPPDGERVTVDLNVTQERNKVTPTFSFLGPPSGRGGIGTLGHYEVLQLLGRGAFGLVFKAFDERLHRFVAIKVLDPQLVATSPPRKRFLREARAAAAVKHENVVQVYAVEEHPLPYMVMEYVDGKSLQELMDGTGPLELPDILHLGRQMAAGLAAAHEKGLIHRDIKPANILIEAGIEQRVKITDFGLARAADDASLTRSGIISGTPMYMAPEQAQGLPLDHRADLFSLGSVLYQMASGRPPFRASTTVAVLRRVADEMPRPIQDIMPSVPDWYCKIVAKLHAKRPEDRFQSAREVADLFARNQAAIQENGRPVSPSISERRPGIKLERNTLIGAALMAMVVLLGVAEFSGMTSFFKRVRSDSAQQLIKPSETEVLPEKKGGEEPTKEIATTPTANEKGKVPADFLRREDISPVVLANLGGGDPAKAPADLVGVFGEGRFRISGIAARAPSFSPDNKTLAVSSENEVHLFDVKSGARRAVFRGFGTVFCTRFSPDGKILAVGDIVVRIVDISSGRILLTLDPPIPGNTTALFFTPNGKQIVTGSQGGSGTAVWDVKTGELVRELPPHFYGGGKGLEGKPIVLARELEDGRINIYSPETGEMLFAGPKWPKLRWPEEIIGASISSDGKQLALGSPKRVAVWDLEKLKADSDAKPLFDKETSGGWVCFENRSGRLWTAMFSTIVTEEKQVRCWDPVTGEQVAAIALSQSRDEVWHALSHDDAILYASPAGRTFVRAYNTKTGEQLIKFLGHEREVLSIAYSPDGRWVASGGRDCTTRIWDVATGKEKHVLSDNSGQIIHVAFNHDGSRVLARDGNGNISVWKTVEGTRVWTARPGDGEWQQARFSPDGRTIAVANREGGAVFLRTATGETIRTWQAIHRGETVRIAFSPDGQQVATSGKDGRIVISDFETGNMLHEFPDSKTTIDSVEFSSDGKTLLTGSHEPDAAIRIWDLTTGEPELIRSRYSFFSLATNGQLFATCGRERSVRLWNLAGPERKSTVLSSLIAEAPHRVVFSPEGRYIASANLDGTIHLYRLNQANEPFDDWMAKRCPPPAGLPEKDWLHRVSTLSQGTLFDAVDKRFRELNPDPNLAIDGGEVRGGQVISIWMNGPKVSDFSALRALPGLQRAIFEETRFSDNELVHLQGAKDLQTFSAAAFTTDTRLTDAATERLREFPNLENLGLWGTNLTDAGLERLANLNQLKHLNIAGTKVTDRGMDTIGKFHDLTVLHLYYLPISDAGLPPLQSLSQLQFLSLAWTQVSDAGLENIRNLKAIRELDLSGLKINGSGLKYLQELPRLKILQIHNAALTNDSVLQLSECKSLESLGLHRCPITDNELPHLAKLSELKWLGLNGTKVTAEGVEKLKKGLPNCRIEWDGPAK
ncbi:MAG: protein kinase domain-containing protein [Planctomycetaceae bacterium]